MIIIKNTHIVVRDVFKDLTDKEKKDIERKLYNNLSLWDKVSRKYIWSSFFIEKGDLLLPRGIEVEKMKEEVFPNREIVYDTKPDPFHVSKFKMKVEPKDDIQRDSIDFLCSQGKYTDLSDNPQRLLCLKTGAGKTFVTIFTSSILKKKPIVIVDRDKILTQWKDQFLKFTDLDEDEIYLIAGSDSIQKILDKRVNIKDYKVIIASYRTIDSHSKYNEEDESKRDYSRITKLFKELKVGVKCYDESHVELRNQVMIDCFSNTDLTIYLTATPKRSDRLENLIYERIIYSIPKYGMDKEYRESDLYHNIVYVDYDSKPKFEEKGEVIGRRGFDLNKFSDYTFREDKYPRFFEMLCKILDNIITRRGKIGIIIHKNEHVQKVYDDLNQYYNEGFDDTNISIGIFSGIIKDRETRERELKKRIIISTDKSLEKAVDITWLRYLIVTTSYSSSVVTEQMLGRLRYIEGFKSLFFDLCDVGFDICKYQRKQRRKILDSKSVSTKDVKM